MITVKELLDQPLFKDLTPLTLPHTLNKEVRTVDVTETPDIAGFTSNKAIILTTAYAFRDSQEELIPFIKSLIQVDVSGLCIKVSRFLKCIDPTVIEFANNHNFPIIEIPSTITLGIMSHSMFDFLLGKETQQVLYAFEIQRQYSSLALSGASPHQILNELSHTIHRPTILISPFKKIMATSSHFNKEHNPAEYYLSQLKPSLESKNSKTKSLTISGPSGNEEEVNIYPIHISDSFPYFLIVLNSSKLNYPIDMFAINQVTMILSFILYKNAQIEKSMIILQNEYFTKIISGKNPSDRNNREYFEEGLNHGLINTNFYQVISCRMIQDTVNKYLPKRTNELIYQWITENLIPNFKFSVSFYNDKTQTTHLLIQYENSRFENYLMTCAQEIFELLGANIKFGIGTVVSHAFEIRDSYYESVKALQYPHEQVINYYTPDGIESLFSQNLESVEYFVRQQLKELTYTKDENELALLETLETFLDNQCEITQTAKLMYLHRNTVAYRIKKCEDILSIDTKNPKHSLNLRLALKLRRMLQNHV